MKYIDTRTKTMQGYRLHTIKTNQFKTLSLYLHFTSPLKREDATKKSLLSQVMKSATADYPDYISLQQKLDDLYGASLNTGVQKRGEQHLFTVQLTTGNDRFLKTEVPLLEEAAAMLNKVINRPLLDESGHFQQSIVEREKRGLKQRIYALSDDKMRHALQRLLDHMCTDEPYNVHAIGYLEEVDGITPQDLKETLEKTLSESQIDLYVIGDIDHDKTEKLFGEQFKLSVSPTGSQRPVPEESVKLKQGDVTFARDHQDVDQGKLAIGYRTPVVATHKDFFATQVFNGLFGGFPNSRLFLNVREKESLAYQVASQYDSYKGLVIAYAGIDFKNYQKTVDIIGQELKAVKDGEFTEKTVEETKQLLKNAIVEALDSAGGTVQTLYREVLTQNEQSVEEWLKGLDQVTKDDVVRAAGQVETDTVYFLDRKAEE